MKTIALIVSILISTGGPYDTTSGTLSATYNRRINNKISVGVQANYTRIILKSSEFVPGIEPSENRVYSDPKPIIYPLAKVDFRYINKPEFEMYSSAMLGLFSIDDGFPLHLTGLGFRVGAKHAFVGELGFGFGHLASIGYSVKI